MLGHSLHMNPTLFPTPHLDDFSAGTRQFWQVYYDAEQDDCRIV